MPLSYVLDEHLRGPLWRAILQHHALGVEPIDALRVGDVPDLPLGTLDPDPLLWAERTGRILLTRDESTMPAYLTNHLQAGRHSPGVFILRPRSKISQVVAFLAYVAYHRTAVEWQDQITYIP
jgi:hypothetical protein